ATASAPRRWAGSSPCSATERSTSRRGYWWSARSSRVPGGWRNRSSVRPVRRDHVTTYGCQMNAHDSERIKGLLESAGLGEAPSATEADVLVFNTCTIREKADGRFLQHLMDARALKQRDPSKQIVVGGCWSES